MPLVQQTYDTRRASFSLNEGSVALIRARPL
jgi:hypothetical protein